MRRLQWMVVVKGELDHSLVLGSFAGLWVFLELGRDLNCDEKFGRTLFFFFFLVFVMRLRGFLLEHLA